MASPPELFRVHGYAGDAFPELAAGGEPVFALAKGQLAAFEQDGFVAGIRVLDEAQVTALRERLDWLQSNARALESRLYEVELAWRERPAEVVFHCLGGWMVDELLHDLIFHPALTVPCAQCLGVDGLRFWHDQVFSKPPGHPGVVPWHQDYSYWQRTAPAAHVTVHVALDDADEENGCLRYVPGSHRWGLGEKVPFDGEMDAFFRQRPGELQLDPVPVRLRAGEAVIHHSHAVHGSGPNRSGRWRRAAVVNFMAPTVRVAEEGPLLTGVPEIPVGEVVEGDHFPIVLERRERRLPI